MNESPLWIEFSGLPLQINDKIRGGGGWAVFKKLLELDCARNRKPDIVEIPVVQLAERAGVKPEFVLKALKGFRNLKIAKVFIPEHEDEEALFRVTTPLKTPLKRGEIEKALKDAGVPGPWSFRYLEKVKNEEAEEQVLQEVVDEYFRSVNLKMNAFILDELRLLTARFDFNHIKRVFQLANKRGIRSIYWVAKELYRQERRANIESKKK